jgi:type II secretory pathway component PulM
MRDDYLKEIETLKDKTNQTVTTNDQLNDIITSSSTAVNFFLFSGFFFISVKLEH